MNAVNVLEGLKASKNLPKIFQRGQYDQTMYRSYALIHDCHCEDPEVEARALQVLSQIQKHFGRSCTLMIENLRLNGLCLWAGSKDSCSLIRINSHPASSPLLSREVKSLLVVSCECVQFLFAPCRRFSGLVDSLQDGCLEKSKKFLPGSVWDFFVWPGCRRLKGLVCH